MTQYQIKEGVPYINVYEGEEPKFKKPLSEGTGHDNHERWKLAKTMFNIAHNNWLASAKSYRVKDEFVDELESEVSAYWSKDKFDRNYGQDLSTTEFKKDCKNGITLPLSIAERIEIKEFYVEPPPHIHSNRGEDVQFAILKPLAVKEATNCAEEMYNAICQTLNQYSGDYQGEGNYDVSFLYPSNNKAFLMLVKAKTNYEKLTRQ